MGPRLVKPQEQFKGFGPYMAAEKVYGGLGAQALVHR